jgi:SAM-dependent methyltransferase
MSLGDETLVSQRWDQAYRSGRYVGDAPLPFVDVILVSLYQYAHLRRRVGLYIGCGNGRHYIPLVDAGLKVVGLDVSRQSLQQLAARRPACAKRLLCIDFRDYAPKYRMSYMIAIQVFQHGTASDVAAYFAKVGRLLQPGGLFFLRVNAASTQIDHPHTVIDRSALGGYTIRYDTGPKQGLPLHFYSRRELMHYTKGIFEPVLTPREDATLQPPDRGSTWVQWEAVWQKKESNALC